jgi:hypothetical protein
MTKYLAVATLSFLMACGSDSMPIGRICSGQGTGGTAATPIPPGPNVVDIVAGSGPEGANYTNGLFASVTLCEPGTGNCQTIDHLLVDTGSVGLRVLESLVTIALPAATNASGEILGECAPFVDGTAWGTLRTADVLMGSHQASSLPVQLIGEAGFTMPTSCTGRAITDFETLGSNGILGVGIYKQDCGLACTLDATSPLNPGLYFACSRTTARCSATAVPEAQQVQHPVAAFPEDNNGVIIQLPSVDEIGAVSVPGVMVFGIGTQSNNGLGSATVLDFDRRNYVSTSFPLGGTAYTGIIDSGSNGLFFLDAATTGLKQCTGGLKDFYCPASTTCFSASILGVSGTPARVDFSVANTSKLNGRAYVFSNLAGAMPGFPSDKSLPAFDWGLPFFLGRTVYTAIEEQDTPAGAGPYLAF